MFGWRKKKPEEEELVPRGMIWYGTTESSSDEPQRAEPPAQPIESEQPAVHTAEVIEMRRPPASERPVDELRPAVNGAFPVSPVARAVASTPLAFQPRRTTETTSGKLSDPVPSQPRFPEITAIIDLSEPEAPAGPSTLSMGIQRGRTWLSTTGARTWERTATGYGKLRRQWSAVSQSVDWRKEFARGRQFAQTWTQSSTTATRLYSQKMQRVLIAATRDGVARSGAVALACKRAFSEAGVYVRRHTAGWRPYANRARVAASAVPQQTRIFFARQLTRWTLRIENAGMDSRLWSSMTLAAISALIALAIVSVVPRYASRHLPSRIALTPSTVNASGPAPANIVVPSAAAEAQPAVVPESPKHPAKLVSAKKVTPAKRKPSVDDDYVAPDTFKYYGDSSRASR